MTNPDPNEDESLPDLPGSFHKTLPHNEYGEVERSAYMHFRDLALAIESGSRLDFEGVPVGAALASYPITPGPGANAGTARFTSPLAGAASETLGPAPGALEMRPAPGVKSLSTAAEMVELYWMALLRDVDIADFQSPAAGSDVALAIDELQGAFGAALNMDQCEGRLRLGLDLPEVAGALAINPQTLFRGGLKDEEHGPLVSQFFLHNIPYGTQTIDARQYPYAAGLDFLITYDDWLLAQNTGKDRFGRDYANCNHSADPVAYHASSPRHIQTLRDLARFVNRDALHQAYFNAALFLDALGAPLDAGNPSRPGGRYARQSGFATLGGPDLLTLVSEVASRALKVVWRQKWLVHRRARPEVYGGLVHMQHFGPPGRPTRPYGLPALVMDSKALRRVIASNTVAAGTASAFLPMAFSAGSPPHPAYGAGHATVAGACVTVLKAWFDESKKLKDLFDDANGPGARKDPPNTPYELKKPGGIDRYNGADAAELTVGGELNKLAMNVAMGRSMGGVHWRSDNTRSLRLGEQVGIEILRKRTEEYAEKAVSFTFTSFDRQTVRIAAGQVTVR